MEGHDEVRGGGEGAGAADDRRHKHDKIVNGKCCNIIISLSPTVL